MRSIRVTLWMTLDGVVQGLARPDEDPRGGFVHGGWGPRYQDDVMVREMGADMTKPGDMLLGRRTWQDFLQVWARQRNGNPVTERMNATTKYVVSRTLTDVSAWEKSVLLPGEAVETVAALKAGEGDDLGIIGSASLVRSLHGAGLIDHYTLLICPVTLGSGARLFADPGPLTELDLDSAVPTSKGVVIARYTRR